MGEATLHLYAHTPNERGEWHLLADHLAGTATLARVFAEPLGPEAAELAYIAGLWHDLGKAHPQFQGYLASMANGTGRKGEGGDHKGAGTVAISAACQQAAFLVAGHHGGLHAGSDLKSRYAEWKAAPRVAEALHIARTRMPALAAPRSALPLPPWVSTREHREMFVRMLFSCLVDADFLDTERHFNAGTASQREGARTPDVGTLWAAMEHSQEALLARGAQQGGTVQAVRAEVYRHALQVAERTPAGFFRLTVPTGGGKTRTSLAFGLRHALAQGYRRVVVAVPFTTITEQTAGAYRDIFPEPGIVLEHHSAAESRDEPHDATGGGLWRRLAAENWDAPIVVTTTVQLFESLLGAQPGRCRKLHNLVGSVIVLDEAQTLPAHLLRPLIAVLQELVRAYQVSVVFCTATQPAFDVIPGLEPIRTATEIAPDPPRLFKALSRVHYTWPSQSKLGWGDVAGLIRAEPRALAIFNTRANALAVLDALGDPEALHLSTLLCGAHRRAVLAAVRERLARGAPVRLVATQVVEAGVDLDFPFVVRALAPLDAIVQAAGRCNREGRLAQRGRVVVVDLAEGGLPPGAYKVATQSASILLAGGDLDADDPATFRRFFSLFYGAIDPDRDRVQSLRAAQDYPEVARLSRLIDDDGESVVVRPPGHEEEVGRLLDEVRGGPARARQALRALQPYLVQVRTRQLQQHAASRLAQEIRPGLWEWLGTYHPVRGIEASRNMDPLFA